MSAKLKIAFVCHPMAALALAGWGAMYLARTEFLSHHAQAVGMPWSEVPVQFQVLVLGLIKLTGGAFVALAGALLIMLFVPFRRGERWAVWAVPAVAIGCCVGLANAMAYVGSRSAASPPWTIMLTAPCLVVIGAVLSLPGRAPGSDA